MEKCKGSIRTKGNNCSLFFSTLIHSIHTPKESERKQELPPCCTFTSLQGAMVVVPLFSPLQKSVFLHFLFQFSHWLICKYGLLWLSSHQDAMEREEQQVREWVGSSSVDQFSNPHGVRWTVCGQVSGYQCGPYHLTICSERISKKMVLFLAL